MGDKTRIEWCDATWNPVTGCTKVSQGCKFCYAEREFPRVYPGRQFTEIKLHPDRLDQPLHWKRPRKIFVNSMSDLFHECVPFDFIEKVLVTMGKANWHVYQILTKRPDRMRNLLNASGTWRLWMDGHAADHIQLGVSVENQPTADERVLWLLQTPAALRFVSYEPALGPVNSSAWLCSPFARYRAGPDADDEIRHLLAQRRNQGINWVIAGGESGPHARPSHPDWFRSVRDQCVAAGVPFFFKQWGEWAPECLQRPGDHVGVCFDGAQVDACGNSDFVRFTREIKNPVVCMTKLGRKRAGRLLDGREWNEFPQKKN